MTDNTNDNLNSLMIYCVTNRAKRYDYVKHSFGTDKPIYHIDTNKYYCPCGSMILKKSLPNHYKTMKHTRYLKIMSGGSGKKIRDQIFI